MARSPDPLDEPQAYQQHLLGLLGEDDPAAAQSGTAGRLEALVRESGDDLRTPPEAGEWSVLQCVGHIVDAEIVYAGRYRWILAHDQPPLIGYDQDRWVERLGHSSAVPGELLELFAALRRANIALWERTPPDERARVGLHEERGPESFELSFRLVAGHDRFHLAQAERALQQVRSGG
jgi:hypothetical protein